MSIYNAAFPGLINLLVSLLKAPARFFHRLVSYIIFGRISIA